MSHFPTSQPTTTFYQRWDALSFPSKSYKCEHLLTKTQIDADNAENVDDYNRVISIALLKAFSCARKLNVYQPFVRNVEKIQFSGNK